MTHMSRRRVIGFLVAVASFTAAGWGYAQVIKSVQPVEPVVLSGPDIGFRVTGQKANVAVGELVVRVDGKWKLAQFAMSVKPVSK